MIHYVPKHFPKMNLTMVRYLTYMEKLVEPRALYRNKLVYIPTPEFFVFYNGDEPFPPEKILRLSDSYLEKTIKPMLELFVKVININLPAGHTILQQCRPLYEYSWFIQRVKEHLREGCERDFAITLAIKDCEEAGIFAEFVREHGSEAVNMLFTQFNMEDALEVRYEEGFEDGQVLKLVDLVCRKLQKGKTAESIAEELDEPVQIIENIVSAVNKCDKNADILTIYKAFQEIQ